MKKQRLTYFIILITLFAIACSGGAEKKQTDKKTQNKNNATQKPETTINEPTQEEEKPNKKMAVVYKEDKSYLKAFYQKDPMKQHYFWKEGEYEFQPINPPDDLTKLSYGELRLLRNEVFARNGYLFNDGFLRGYFNRFDWYKPIFDVEDFQVVLNTEEKKLIERISEEEKKRKAKKTIPQGNLNIYNADLIVNKKQFVSIPDQYLSDFKSQNFSIINANRAMPFYTYDQNAYQYIPHYITTDLYLFILHKYFSRSLEKLDENFMFSQLKELLTGAESELDGLSKKLANNPAQSYVEWAQAYCAIARYAAGDKSAKAPEKYNDSFKNERLCIDKKNGNPDFIENQFLNYNELTPRGHYTKSDKLKDYFKGFKWISLSGVDVKKDQEFGGLVALAFAIKNESELYSKYQKYVSTVEKLAGKEDNLSIRDIIEQTTASSLEEAVSKTQLEELKNKLNSLNKEKIKMVLGERFKNETEEVSRIYFLSSTYSISGDIFSKLVHVNQNQSKRPFPKGLDIAAVLGNKAAKDILLNEYKEGQKWEAYPGKLAALQEQFSTFPSWNSNYGARAVKTAMSAAKEASNYPDFMKTDAYNRKELSTALASWTHVKHDLILYQEKPYAAEAGQGGGPEPPKHISYVEPNMEFWNSALDLVNWLEKFSTLESSFTHELQSIKQLGTLLKTVAQKQLNGVKVSRSEFDNLHYVGGTIEHTLLSLLETDHLPEREKSMALIADVYIYNGTNLNVAVGHADDIYTIVPINNEYHITRGSIFSYYEFNGKIHTDESWRARIHKKELPKRPEWLKPLIRSEKELEGNMQYRY